MEFQTPTIDMPNVREFPREAVATTQPGLLPREPGPDPSATDPQATQDKFVVVHGLGSYGVEFSAVLTVALYLVERDAGEVRNPHYLAGPFDTQSEAQLVANVFQAGFTIEAYEPKQFDAILRGEAERTTVDYRAIVAELQRDYDAIDRAHKALAEQPLPLPTIDPASYPGRVIDRADLPYTISGHVIGQSPDGEKFYMALGRGDAVQFDRRSVDDGVSLDARRTYKIGQVGERDVLQALDPDRGDQQHSLDVER